MDKRAEALETINQMTKAEIITWLSGDIGMLFRPPSKSQLLSARWKTASDAAMERRNKNKLAPGFAEKLDNLNAKLCKASDHKQFAAIFEEIKTLQKIWKKYLDEIKACQKEDDRVEVLWNEYMEQSEKENPRSRAIQETETRDTTTKDGV